MLSGVWQLAEDGNEQVLQADKVSIGLTYQQKGLIIDVEGYAQQVNGISSVSAITSTGLGSTIGESKVFGLDLLLQKDIGPHQIWLNYSLLDNRYLFRELQNSWFAADNDHRHNLSITGKASRGKWTGLASFNMRSGLPYSPVDGLELIGDDEDDYTIRLGELNSRRLKPFRQFDLSLNYRAALPLSGTRIEVNLSVLNVLGRDNPYARRNVLVEFDDDEQPDILSVEKKHLSRTPQALIRIYF